jgi:transcription elongation GreA/GreB family factor
MSASSCDSHQVSKAFTKEDDDAPVAPAKKRGLPVPTDVPNYITAAGERALRAELADSQDPDRAHEISEHLATAIVMEPPADRSRVGFGATVTVEDGNAKHVKYRIVGAIEASPRDGAIYFKTPIAEELHDMQVGDTIDLPRGQVEIIAIDYD